MIEGIREGFSVMQSSNATLARIAVVGALVAALGLAGCGRKSGLDPPPAAAVPMVAKMPAPMIAPMPSAIRLSGPSVRLS